MVDVEVEIFNAIYNKVIQSYPTADFATHYVNQPSSFPHIQVYDESNTVNRNGMDLAGHECFSNIVIHLEIFDNMLNGEGKTNVKAILALIDPEMRLKGFRRTYCAPVPNFQDASIYREVVRYSKLQENN